LLTIENLSASYRGVTVVSGVSFTVPPCGTLALLGTNGAGKSTLIKALLGLGPEVRGVVRFDRRDITDWPTDRRIRLGIGYVPEGRRVFPGLSVAENLDVAALGPPARARQALERVLALFPQLLELAAVRAWRLSGGQQQMLAIGRALMGSPRLLLLDEPTLGLAPRLADAVFAALAEIAAAGTALVIAEEHAARAQTLCTAAITLTPCKGTPIMLNPIQRTVPS